MADFGHDRASAVEDLLSRRIGERVTLRGASLLADASSSRMHERSFWRLRISGCRDYKNLHAKVMPKRLASSGRTLRTNRLEAGLSGRGLPVADFLGAASINSYSILLWEHREGATSRSFRHLEPRDAERIAQAVAQIGALSGEIDGAAKLQKGICWVEPVCDRIRRTLNSNQLASVERQFEEFAAIEKDVIARLNSIEAKTLTHNDVKAPNVLISPKAITLVDWESATLGPHGASLRRFVRHGSEIERTAAQTYVRTLMQNGLRVDLAQVLFVMRFQEIFWALCTGVRLGRAKRIMDGLQLLPKILSRPESY